MDKNDRLVYEFLFPYTKNTKEAYGLDIKLFKEYCYSIGISDFIFDAKRPHFDMFSVYLKEVRNNSDASIHRRVSALKMFFRILHEDGEIPLNPAKNARLPKVNTNEIKTESLSAVELSSFLKAAEESNPNDSALCALMGMLAMRVSSVCNLNIEDIYEKNGHVVLTFIGKGNKKTTKPIDKYAVQLIDYEQTEKRFWIKDRGK